MIFGCDREQFYGIKSDSEIIDASKKVFRSVVRKEPSEHLDEKGEESLDKNANINIDGIKTDGRIVGKLHAQPESDVLCVIVLAPVSIEAPEVTKFYINFIELDDKESVTRCEQVIICSGEDACIVGVGSPKGIAVCAKTLYQQALGKGALVGTWFRQNKTYLIWIAASALFLAGARNILKKRNPNWWQSN